MPLLENEVPWQGFGRSHQGGAELIMLGCAFLAQLGFESMVLSYHVRADGVSRLTAVVRDGVGMSHLAIWEGVPTDEVCNHGGPLTRLRGSCRREWNVKEEGRENRGGRDGLGHYVNIHSKCESRDRRGNVSSRIVARVVTR